jgi:hypothetical protein
VLDQRLFQCAYCGALVAICRACDHGGEYCPGPCRQESRKIIVSEAKRRHRQSAEGRADNRDHQRAHRERRRQRVRDLATGNLPASTTVRGPADARDSVVEPPVVAERSDDERHDHDGENRRPETF